MKRVFILFIILSFGFSVFGQNLGENSSSQSKTDADERLKTILEKVGRSVQVNLDSIKRVAFTEVVRQQELKDDASPTGKPKNFIYESIVTNQPVSETTVDFQPTFTRKLKSINGKAVKNETPLEVSKCEPFNPPPAYESPLSFLMPKNQSRYIFSLAGETTLDGKKTVLLTIAEKPPTEPLTIIEKNDCYFLSRPLQMKGKVWLDGATFDIAQIQWQQAETFAATIPKKTVRVGLVPHIRPALTISYDAQDYTVGFRLVKFENYEQPMLLPYFSENVWLNRGARLAGMRTRVDYTQYRLFNTNVQITDFDKG